MTLGSSGAAHLLPAILEGLASLPVTVLVATAGRTSMGALPANAYAAEFLPGSAAARRAALVIGNGGSPTAYQALAEGVPVLGIAGNLDQQLAIHYIARAGAGRLLRPEYVRAARVRRLVEKMLATPSYFKAAQRVACEFAAWPAPERFQALVTQWLGTPTCQQQPTPSFAVAH